MAWAPTLGQYDQKQPTTNHISTNKYQLRFLSAKLFQAVGVSWWMRQTRSCLQWASVLVAEDRQGTRRHINTECFRYWWRSEAHSEVTARCGQVVRKGLLGRWHWRWALFFSWGITDTEHYINFRCTAKRFQNCICCEMTSTMRLADVHHHRSRAENS